MWEKDIVFPKDGSDWYSCIILIQVGAKDGPLRNITSFILLFRLLSLDSDKLSSASQIGLNPFMDTSSDTVCCMWPVKQFLLVHHIKHG